MRTHRTFVLGAALLALVVSACSPGEDESPDASTGAGGSQAADLPTLTIGSAGFWESAVVAEIFERIRDTVGVDVVSILTARKPNPQRQTVLQPGQVR